MVQSKCIVVAVPTLASMSSIGATSTTKLGAQLAVTAWSHHIEGFYS